MLIALKIIIGFGYFKQINQHLMERKSQILTLYIQLSAAQLITIRMQQIDCFLILLHYLTNLPPDIEILSVNSMILKNHVYCKSLLFTQGKHLMRLLRHPDLNQQNLILNKQWVFEHVNNSLKCQNSVSMTEKSEQQLNTPKETTPKQQNINFMRSQGTNQDLSLKDLGDSQTVDVQDLMLQNNVNVKVTRGVIIQINVKPNQQTCECPNQKDLDNSGVTQKYIDKQTLDENYQRQVVARSKFPQMSYDQLKQHLFICTQTSIENFPKPIIKQSTQQKTESQLKQLEIFSSILQVSEIDSYFMYSSESKLSQEVKNSIQKAMMNPQNKIVQYIPRGTQNVSELAILSYLKLLRYCQNVIENNLINKEAMQDWHEKDFYEKVRAVIHAQGY
ncbi:Hypothetical_protein [Hexamita inflata]|uniref:Hypothetical_protein n=1 Tax=Hexamita inflata TaxID=28002 RepID=A0AA86NYB8_9EUKA|nr:Hypothetical protein HINF_LOCUS15943 [Hexamita inflata]